MHGGSGQAVLPESVSWSAQERSTELLRCQVACLDIRFINNSAVYSRVMRIYGTFPDRCFWF
jgi:hypothetical protein